MKHEVRSTADANRAVILSPEGYGVVRTLTKGVGRDSGK